MREEGWPGGEVAAMGLDKGHTVALIYTLCVEFYFTPNSNY
jgi:hypothetical protein